MQDDENRTSKQDPAGSPGEADTKRHDDAGLRGPDQPHGSLVDQDTPGKREPVAQPRHVTNVRTPEQDAQHGADVRGGIVPTSELANQAPEGLWRERKGPLGAKSGRGGRPAHVPHSPRPARRGS